jgi:hypothetical protein
MGFSARKVGRYFDSMAGRLFLLLLIGVIGSACLALGLANVRRQADLQQLNLAFIASRAQDFISLLNGASSAVRRSLVNQGIPGLHRATGKERPISWDTQFTAVLAARDFGAGSRASPFTPRSTAGSYQYAWSTAPALP